MKLDGRGANFGSFSRCGEEGGAVRQDQKPRSAKTSKKCGGHPITRAIRLSRAGQRAIALDYLPHEECLVLFYAGAGRPGQLMRVGIDASRHQYLLACTHEACKECTWALAACIYSAKLIVEGTIDP